MDVTGAYGNDLAEIHHRHFGDLARQAAPVVLSALGEVGASGLVVDLGCGSGILARALTDAGYDVLGVDYSEDMLRIARRHAPKATFERAALLDVDLPSCAAVTAVGEVFNYAFDPRTGASELPVLFQRIARALRPGGVLIFDVAGPGRLGRRERLAVRDGRDWTLIRSAQEDAEQATLTRDITVFRKVGELYRRSDERHVLRLYRRDEVAAHLDAAGLRVQRLHGYGGVRFERGWAGFKAVSRKR